MSRSSNERMSLFPARKKVMSSGSRSTRSSRHTGVSSQDGSSQDTRSHSGYLDENLLEEPAVQRPFVESASREIPARPLKPSRLRQGNTDKDRLVIAIDYGTTFTGVAYATARSNIAQLSQIEVMQDWGPKMGNQHKVPSVYSYSLTGNGEEQWGTDISENAVTMVNTKLELEVQDTKLDELKLTLQVLEGTGNLAFANVKNAGAFPEYTWRTPPEIVTDYLTKVCGRLCQAIGLGNPVGTKNLVDIVVTVPVKWSYQATNSTFRAVRKAGFNKQTFPTLNDTILVTEAEAASYFTARHVQEGGTNFLKMGENFVLCDAGGGTVDVIAFQVKKIEPLELEQVSFSTSDKCGATYVDTNFKRWLHRTIGAEKYNELDPSNAGRRIGTHATESGLMRQLMKDFDVKKKSFSKNTQIVKLDLPGSLSELTLDDRVRQGELVISCDEMKEFFNPCVNKVVALVEGQRQQVERKNNRRVKNVFLVGGFGESPYLQEELQISLKLRQITMRRPEPKQSWTAVVQGAIIYGIEKARHKNVRHMSASKRSYGVVADETSSVYRFNPDDHHIDILTGKTTARKQFSWLIRKGDLIMSDQKRTVEKSLVFTFRSKDSRNFPLPVYVYPNQVDEDDEEDDAPERWETGQHEVKPIGFVQCDISHFPAHEFEWRQNQYTKENHCIVHVVCRMQISLTCLEVEVLVNAARIGYTSIPTESINSRGTSADSEEDEWWQDSVG